MGQILEGGSVSTGMGIGVSGVPAGYMGEFGNGLWRVFQVPGTYTFTVPNNVTKIRARVVGGGGGGRQNGAGAAGGGYAHGEFTVTPGTNYTVTVGAGGVGNATTPTDGGTSSFGALISATGGGAAIALGGAVGGVGTGGDFQAKGGSVGNNAAYGGGAGAGSQLGDGGSVFGYGGAGVVCSTYENYGSSAFGISSAVDGSGPDILGDSVDGSSVLLLNNSVKAVIRFPFDGFTGGGGRWNSTNNGLGGHGAGGGAGSTSQTGGKGGVGGGGGGNVTTSNAGSGGIGGGGGSTGGAGGAPGNGGNGLVIVEW